MPILVLPFSLRQTLLTQASKHGIRYECDTKLVDDPEPGCNHVNQEIARRKVIGITLSLAKISGWRGGKRVDNKRRPNISFDPSSAFRLRILQYSWQQRNLCSSDQDVVHRYMY